jgi:hypothetical protein
MTPREIGNSDFHPALGRALANDLPQMIRKTLREPIRATGFQNHIDDSFSLVVFDGVVIAEGDTLTNPTIEQPIDVGDDDLFELPSFDQLRGGFGFGRHASDRMQRRCHV